jgi:hypothetical protein
VVAFWLEELQVSLTPQSETEPEDLPNEEVEASKRKSRINALILAATFVIITLAPDPYKFFAPLLFLIPVILSLINRMRNASNDSGIHAKDLSAQPSIPKPNGFEPYSYTPRDPQDPRRYKPIG